jgi:hypothetical protein
MVVALTNRCHCRGLEYKALCHCSHCFGIFKHFSATSEAPTCQMQSRLRVPWNQETTSFNVVRISNKVQQFAYNICDHLLARVRYCLGRRRTGEATDSSYDSSSSSATAHAARSSASSTLMTSPIVPACLLGLGFDLLVVSATLLAESFFHFLPRDMSITHQMSKQQNDLLLPDVPFIDPRAPWLPLLPPTSSQSL